MELRTEKVCRKSKDYPAICNLMKTAFPKNELFPMWLLRLLARRKSVNYLAFYSENDFCGILYTVENDDCLFVLYLAVNAQIRSRGLGSQIIQWIKERTTKNIVLCVETPDDSAENPEQRKRRISFYQRNGFSDTGYSYFDGDSYSILSSDSEHFNLSSYKALLKSFSFGLIHNTINAG